MNVSEIIKQYLKANGYEGLCCVGDECGCPLDDLFACGDLGDLCEPAYHCTHTECWDDGDLDEVFCAKNPATCEKLKPKEDADDQ